MLLRATILSVDKKILRFLCRIHALIGDETNERLRFLEKKNKKCLLCAGISGLKKLFLNKTILLRTIGMNL